MDLFADQLTVNSKATLREALEVMSAARCGAVIVVSEDNMLLGVLSDGDVRRAMLQSATLMTPVEKVMNTHPVSISLKDESSAKDVFAREIAITILPVVDEGNKLTRVLKRGSV